MKATRRDVLRGAVATATVAAVPLCLTRPAEAAQGTYRLDGELPSGAHWYRTGNLWLNLSDGKTWYHVSDNESRSEAGIGTIVKDGSGWKLVRV